MKRLTQQEAIAALERLAARWPRSLWLWSASGTLYLMRCGPDGMHALDATGGVDRDYIVTTIPIPNDGGDW